MSLHPQVAALLERASRSPLPPYYEVPPAVARRLYRDSRAALTPDSPAVDSVQLRLAPGPAGPVPVRHYRPKGAAKDERLPALVYYHGGGWVIGDLDTHDVVCRTLANAARCVVFSVDTARHPRRRFRPRWKIVSRQRAGQQPRRPPLVSMPDALPLVATAQAAISPPS